MGNNFNPAIKIWTILKGKCMYKIERGAIAIAVAIFIRTKFSILQNRSWKLILFHALRGLMLSNTDF